MATPRGLTPLEAANEIRNANNGQVVLVLQGGGALGAYQGGVYQALHDAGIEPDWLIGTSIGAINASIIAGNKRGRSSCQAPANSGGASSAQACWGAFPAWTGVADALPHGRRSPTGIPGFFETNPRAFLGAHVPLGADHAGYYSTEPLRQTLEELVDFSLINSGHPRLTVGAAHVRTSMMHYFDSPEMEITPSHIMASGALPPAFPAVRIDGELYWDGGILSNTPTERIFDDSPRRNSLIFAVHLWNPTGAEPETIWEILQPAQGHPIFEPHREPHRAPARSAQAPPRHHRAARIRAREGEAGPAVAGARRLSLRHAHACGAAARARVSTMRATPRTSTSRRTASVSAGRPVMPKPAARSSGSLDRRVRRCSTA